MKEEKKKVIKKYIFLFFVFFIVLTSVFIMIRYQVEGETQMPYKLNQIVIKSTLGSKDLEGDQLWNIELLQNNDIYIYINKDDNHHDDLKIEKVSIENIKFENIDNTEKIKVLLPTGNNLDNIYVNSTKDYKNEKIEFLGSNVDSLDKHEICEEGGMIAFRIENSNLGTYTSDKDKEIKYDSSLLEKAKIDENSLKYKVSFDLIIETTSGVKYKTTLNYEMPVDSFKDSGINTKVVEDFSNVVFKRE